MSRWSGVIGSTTNSGAITPRVQNITAQIPRGPLYERALFLARLAGGASGTVGIQIYTNVAGVTVQIAGRTAMTTPGSYHIPNVLGISSSLYAVPRPYAIEFAGTGTGSSYNATVTMSAVDSI